MSCVCASHQQPRCLHFKQGRCIPKPMPVIISAPDLDAARRIWLEEQDQKGYRMGSKEIECARAAFEAGWDACTLKARDITNVR